MISQDQYNSLFQSSRILYIRVGLLNKNNKKVDQLEGVVTDGSVNLDGTSTIRRTCNISLVITDSSVLIGNDKKIWLDKRVHIEVGLKDIVNDNIVWFNMGKYLINQPSISYSATDNSLSFSGVDLMAIFNGSRDGELINKVVIPENTPIHEAIKMSVTTLGGYPNVLVEESTRNTPYEIEVDGGSSIESLIKEIADLYMDMEYFIDLEGNFVFQRIRKKVNDAIMFDFTQMPQDLIINYSTNYDFENVKNSFTVYGKLLDNGTQVIATSKIEDINNPLNINSSIGEIKGFYKEDKIFNIEQAKTRADYELEQHSNLKQSVNISTVPIYSIDMNRIVYLKNDALELEGRFLVVGASIPLSVEGEMTIQLIKEYS